MTAVATEDRHLSKVAIAAEETERTALMRTMIAALTG